MLTLLQWVAVALGSLVVAGTLLSLSEHPHWSVRLWDFPRVQMALAAAGSAIVYVLLSVPDHPAEWLFLAAVTAAVAWQIMNIYPYTPLARVQVERSELDGGDGRRLCLVISNVLMENTRHDLLIRVIREADADVVLAVETDDRWARALEPLKEEYPHHVFRPQDNYYGLVLLSRLPLIDPRIDFLVQDDIPSVHTLVELPCGERVALHGLHPRPPEPIRDQDSTPRDAELVLVGRAIGEAEERPTVVAGDLNDVAWSSSTRLFLRLSRLLDPRIGRGFYNSYNAKNPLFRYPLDHIFHSRDFRLVKLTRLPRIGSDHFPMLVELSYEPDAARDQDGLEREADDHEEAAERLDRQAEAAANGDDRPGRE